LDFIFYTFVENPLLNNNGDDEYTPSLPQRKRRRSDQYTVKESKRKLVSCSPQKAQIPTIFDTGKVLEVLGARKSETGSVELYILWEGDTYSWEPAALCYEKVPQQAIKYYQGRFTKIEDSGPVISCH